MKSTLSILTIFLCAYLIGGINPAYIIARQRGFDIRRTGTGNAGAANAVLSFGKRTGVLIALMDILKAYCVIRLSAFVFPGIGISEEAAGAGCVIGHMYPVQLRFKGGKGLSCLGGVILAFSPMWFLLLGIAELILAFIVGYLSIIPMTAAILFPIIYIVSGGSWIGFAMYMCVSILMESKHIENIRRIKAGTEVRISYLWNKEKELSRISKNKEESDNEKLM